MARMNYIAPNFYFQHGDELCLKTSIPYHSHVIQDMLAANPAMSIDSNCKLKKARPKKARAPAGDDAANDQSCRGKKKKIIHRDVERQRREKMSVLYMSLRSLLPLEYLKGKRAISDYLNEATNYIKHLQKKIQELEEKRDQLKRVILSSSDTESPLKGSTSYPHITVRTTFSGAVVIIVGLPTVEVPLSRAIAALEEEGLNVVAVSSCIKGQPIYTLECEIDDPREVDTKGLEEKLRDSICLSN